MGRLLRRYKSPIYGNYRKWYVVCGICTGLVMCAAVMVLWLSGNPINSPETYLTDAVLGVCILFSAYLYKDKLPEEKVFFKELMLLGLGIGVVGGLVYGLLLLVYGQMDCEFVERCATVRISFLEVEDSVGKKEAIELIKGYSIGDWAFIGGFRSAVMSVILAFVAALIFGESSKKSPLNDTLDKK